LEPGAPSNAVLVQPEDGEEAVLEVPCEDGQSRAWYKVVDYDKGTQMNVIGDCRLNGQYPAPNALPPTTGQLKRDLVNCYYWSGNFIIDYIYFVFQWHPFIGMFLSHPQHPWSKPERLIQFIIETLWTLLPTLAVSQLCEGDETCQSVSTKMYVTLPNCIISYFLYYMLILDINFQDVTVFKSLQKTNYWITNLMAKCASFVACSFLACCFCGAMCVSIFAMVAIVGKREVDIVTHHETAAKPEMGSFFMQNLLQARVQAYLFWFIYMSILPYVGFFHGWYLERKAMLKTGHSEGRIQAVADGMDK